MKRILFIIIVSTVFAFSNCQDSEFIAHGITKHLIGNELNMNWEMIVYPGNMVAINDDSNFKLIIHIPDDLCNPCVLNFIEACNRYAKKYETRKLSLYLIMDGKDDKIKDFVTVLEECKGVYVIHDINKSFLNINSIEKYTDHFHSFLLDQSNKILLIGNPLRSKRVFDLYDKRLKD